VKISKLEKELKKINSTERTTPGDERKGGITVGGKYGGPTAGKGMKVTPGKG